MSFADWFCVKTGVRRLTFLLVGRFHDLGHHFKCFLSLKFTSFCVNIDI